MAATLKHSFVDRPLVSICVINYNGSQYLEECILSILAQTYKRVEVVFCDDASTDDSIAIFERLILESPDTLVNRQYSLKNMGAERNMLNGLRAFKGDYVCNIDSDDILRENHIEVLLSTLLASSSDISCTNHEEFSEDKEDIHISPQSDLLETSVFRVDEVLETLFLGEQIIPFAYWHRLYIRKFAKKLTEIPPEFFENSDSSFSLAQLCQAETIAYTNIPTYLYRVRRDSVSHKSRYKYLRQKTIYSLDKMSLFYSNKIPSLIELNAFRNNKAIAQTLIACVEENLGLVEFATCYRKYINMNNKSIVGRMIYSFFGANHDNSPLRINPLALYRFLRKIK